MKSTEVIWAILWGVVSFFTGTIIGCIAGEILFKAEEL